MGVKEEDVTATEPKQAKGVVRWAYLAAGFGFVGLGAVGAVVPGLPTTVFLILATWAFARSSPRFHDWLFYHPRFGPTLQRWREHRVIPAHVKAIALGCMVVSFVVLGLSGDRHPLLLLGVAGVIIWGALFILNCPSVPSSRKVER